MSPYIVTTKKQTKVPNSRIVKEVEMSRRAVATPDQARRIARDAGAYAYQAEAGIDESGGTVGPLPDGTVIHVLPTQWLALCGAMGMKPAATARLAEMAEAGDVAAQAQILDVYNATRGVTA